MSQNGSFYSHPIRYLGIIVGRNPAENWDVYVPLLSLPKIFETKLETIPNHVPYIYAAAKKIEYKEIPIRDTPPSKAELKRMLKHFDGNIRKLFNTSGMDYKAGNYKDKLPELTDAQAIDELNANGNLVKRPFMIAKEFGTVGFKEDIWDDLLG